MPQGIAVKASHSFQTAVAKGHTREILIYTADMFWSFQYLFIPMPN